MSNYAQSVRESTPLRCFCGKLATMTFTRDGGTGFARCKKHGKPLLRLADHGRMAVPRGRR